MKKRFGHFLLVLAVISLLSYSAYAACFDQDNDGYGVGTCAGEDCNDNDPWVHPGVVDLCGNEIDDNCNGEIDETSCTYCADYDSDRYGSPGSADCGPGFAETDCDNNNKDINPAKNENTFELCIDGLDNNCNGLIDKDDQSCLDYYPPAGLFPGECRLESPIWTDSEGNKITDAEPSGEAYMTVFAENCAGKDADFTIYSDKTKRTTNITSSTFFGKFQDENGDPLNKQAIAKVTLPKESGTYYFVAKSETSSATSDELNVEVTGAATGGGGIPCQVKWDCSSIPYNDCKQGIQTRDVCPGQSLGSCCTNDLNCACTPLYPEGDCSTYTYDKPTAEKTCTKTTKLGSEGKMLAMGGTSEEETQQQPAKFPWLPVILIISLVVLGIGLTVYFLAFKKPAINIPAALVEYIKAAKQNKMTDQAIRDALTKKGWKPEQINGALKQASKK